jgi:hypothetical protein
MAVTNNNANWVTDAFGVTTNVLDLLSASATSAWAQAATWAVLMDASSGGNAWDGGALASPVQIRSAGDVIDIPVGALAIAA